MNTLVKHLVVSLGVVALGLTLRSQVFAGEDCDSNDGSCVTGKGSSVTPIPSGTATTLAPAGTVGTITGPVNITYTGDGGFYVSTPQLYAINYGGGFTSSVATGAFDVQYYYPGGGYEYVFSQ